MFNNLLIPLTASQSTSGSIISMLLMFVPIILVMYLFLILPQKKKEKKEAQMRNDVQIGDEVITVGGIVGIVFSIKDDTVVIETGGDRSKIRIKKYAIARNETSHES